MSASSSGGAVDQIMRRLDVLFFAFCAGIVLVVAVGEFVPAPPNPDMKIMALPLAFVALADLGIGFFMRKSILDAARETLRRSPNDATALTAWQRGHFLSFVFAESTAVFGLAVRLLTGAIEFALPLFVAGAVALILWRPQRPDA